MGIVLFFLFPIKSNQIPLQFFHKMDYWTFSVIYFLLKLKPQKHNFIYSYTNYIIVHNFKYCLL